MVGARGWWRALCWGVLWGWWLALWRQETEGSVRAALEAELRARSSNARSAFEAAVAGCRLHVSAALRNLSADRTVRELLSDDPVRPA